LEIVCFVGREGFMRLLPQWEQLAARIERTRFMQHPDWYRALFDASLVHADEFLFVAAFDGERLVCVAPLHLDTQCVLGVKINRLGLYRHPHMALADFLVDEPAARPGLMGELVDWLQRARPVPWEMLAFDKSPERSGVGQLLGAKALRLSISAVSGHSAYLATDSEESALGPVSASFKRNLRRLAKRAEETAPLRFIVCNTPATLEPALVRFLEIEASGWKGASGLGSAIANHSELVTFYQTLAAVFGARGHCTINFLYHGDDAIAAQFGLLVGRTYNILKIGYSQAHGALAPGNLMMERSIRWCCAQTDILELSFVTGPAWSHLWKPRCEPVSHYRVFDSGVKGRLLHGALRAKRWYENRLQLVIESALGAQAVASSREAGSAAADEGPPSGKQPNPQPNRPEQTPPQPNRFPILSIT